MSEAVITVVKEPSASRKALHLGATLFLVTAVTGVILGFVEWGTRRAIEKAQMEAKAEALRNVLPEAESFEAVPLAADAGAEITEVQRCLGKDGQPVGYCVSVAMKGYGGPVTLVVGILNRGVVTGINILSQSETPGLGARSTDPEFYGQFAGKDKLPLRVVKGAASAPDEIAAISGATITSNAVTGGVNRAVDYWKKNLEGQK